MSMVAEKEMRDIGKTKAAADHDHDLIHELSKRLDAVWRFDQYITNAEGHEQLKEFWQHLKGQEQENVKRLKELVAKELENDCF